MFSKEPYIKYACSHYGYKWPNDLASGVMFWQGIKITIQEFNEWAKHFNAAPIVKEK